MGNGSLRETGEERVGNLQEQEPITKSVQLLCICVTAFSQTGLFLH